MTDAEAIDVVNPGPEAVEDTANELEEEREKHRKR